MIQHHHFCPDVYHLSTAQRHAKLCYYETMTDVFSALLVTLSSLSSDLSKCGLLWTRSITCVAEKVNFNATHKQVLRNILQDRLWN